MLRLTFRPINGLYIMHEKVLRYAAIYNILWGTWVVAFPNSLFQWGGMSLPLYPQIWQSVGMIVGVYGVGYWFASKDSLTHWPIVLVGFLGKVFGPLGIFFHVYMGNLGWPLLVVTFFNDLIWLPFFASILYAAFYYHTNTEQPDAIGGGWDLLGRYRLSGSSTSLKDAQNDQPVLLVFLRHLGCTFCREQLDLLKQAENDLRKQFILPVVVHMESDEDYQILANKKEIAFHHVQDSTCELYRFFGLRRASFKQVFGWKIWVKGLRPFLQQKVGLLKKNSDGFRLGGSFLIYRNEILNAQAFEDASGHSNIKEVLSSCPIDNSTFAQR